MTSLVLSTLVLTDACPHSMYVTAIFTVVFAVLEFGFAPPLFSFDEFFGRIIDFYPIVNIVFSSAVINGYLTGHMHAFVVYAAVTNIVYFIAWVIAVVHMTRLFIRYMVTNHLDLVNLIGNQLFGPWSFSIAAPEKQVEVV